MKIYIISHKDYDFFDKYPEYQPILVGANKNKSEKILLKDNSSEDNISDKNQSYCELTGVYHVWKNENEDIVGICHYRRYFSTSKKFRKYTILTPEKCRNILKDHDIILPGKGNNEYNGMNARDFFIKNHDVKVWDKCREVIGELHPDYLPDFDWFANEKTGYCYNMLICNKKIFDEYTEWMFDILFELEKHIDLDEYDNYNKRMLGFVSERLINMWVHHKKLKVFELPVYFTEGKTFVQKVKGKLKK